MSISTFAELKTAIADHMARDDLTSFLPDFIVLGETILNFGMQSAEYSIEPLRVRDMETTSTLTPTDGVVSLPSTFLQPRRVVEDTSPRRPLEYITPETVDYFYPTESSGLADHYTIIGSSLYTYPLASNDIDVHHYRTIPPLASNDPNWLLTKNPNIYLRASLLQAYLFCKDDAEAVKQGSILKALIAGMNAADARATMLGAGVYLTGPTP